MQACLPRLTDFSQLLNIGEIDVFTTKLNLKSKLTLARHFNLRTIKRCKFLYSLVIACSLEFIFLIFPTSLLLKMNVKTMSIKRRLFQVLVRSIDKV